MQNRTETARPQIDGNATNGIKGGESAIVDSGAEEKDGNESDESSGGSSSSDSASSDSSDSEMETFELDKNGNAKPNRRPFVGSIFEGKLASFIICDECKNGMFSRSRFRVKLQTDPNLSSVDSLAHKGGLYGSVAFTQRRVRNSYAKGELSLEGSRLITLRADQDFRP